MTGSGPKSTWVVTLSLSSVAVTSAPSEASATSCTWRPPGAIAPPLGVKPAVVAIWKLVVSSVRLGMTLPSSRKETRTPPTPPSPSVIRARVGVMSSMSQRLIVTLPGTAVVNVPHALSNGPSLQPHQLACASTKRRRGVDEGGGAAALRETVVAQDER